MLLACYSRNQVFILFIRAVSVSSSLREKPLQNCPQREEAVSAELEVRPKGLKMIGVESHVVRGSKVELQCIVQSARPPANVTWYNGTTPLQESSSKLEIQSKKEWSTSREEIVAFPSCIADSSGPLFSFIDVEDAGYVPLAVVPLPQGPLQKLSGLFCILPTRFVLRPGYLSSESPFSIPNRFCPRPFPP
ncbi:unnamed protein product [Nezara viridula]|uniref:Ig-like domain-containing protein n=1 Tax=Nezara viridula TaxID=85310 RepID=A0A9P0H5X7_NEZVI|nr:unnamed protein product [Nezara viridula]